MLLFRSEEHIDRWREEWNQPAGEAFTLRQMWGLARVWYGPDRRDPDWRRYNLDEVRAIFASLDFASPFWQLGG